jgi:DNA helicase HerA-like ATPase
MSDEDLTIIGRRIAYSDTIAEAFGISRIDRRRHLYVQGKTGSGKSTLLTSMIAQDLARGDGVCLIDPLGHIAEQVLSYVPRSRTEQVRYLNVADLERPVGLNILAGHDAAHRHRAAAAVVDVFSSIWDLSLARTPQLLDVLGFAVAALTEVPGATLLLLPRFLTDKGYRVRMVETFVTDPAVRAYWRDDFGKRSPREQRETCGSVLNKANELRAPLNSW